MVPEKSGDHTCGICDMWQSPLFCGAPLHKATPEFPKVVAFFCSAPGDYVERRPRPIQLTIRGEGGKKVEEGWWAKPHVRGAALARKQWKTVLSCVGG